MKHLPGSIGIGRGEGGFLRGIPHPQIPELAQAAGKSPAYLSQAFGLGQLAKKHGDIMIPGVVAFGIPL
jgi:hypothetical protein